METWHVCRGCVCRSYARNSWILSLLSMCLLLSRSLSLYMMCPAVTKSRIIRRLSSIKLNVRKEFGITEKKVFGRNFFFKRDDMFSFPELAQVTGNKVRKLHSLYYQPHLPPFVISYGGVQSNAMRALAAVCRFKGSEFVYLSRPLPKQLEVDPIGNYNDALNDNMKLVALSSENYRSLVQQQPPFLSAASLPPNILSTIFDQTGIDLKSSENRSLFLPQGIAHELAEQGIFSLAAEIHSFIQFHRQSMGDYTTPWKIIFATGTGISAFYAARYFHSLYNHDKIEVIAVPCASSSKTLSQELLNLQKSLYPSSAHSLNTLPTVLSTENFPFKRVFGGLYPEHFKIWQALTSNSTNQNSSQSLLSNVDNEELLEFDLLYAPRTWELLLSSCDGNNDTVLDDTGYNLERLFPGHHLLYYHCGGCEGNDSQLRRYRRKGLL